jgi:hypothetical protein
MVPQDPSSFADGAEFVVTHDIVGCKLIVGFRGERFEAGDILRKSYPYAIVEHLAELVKHPQNLGSGRVMLLNCFDRPHNLASTYQFF